MTFLHIKNLLHKSIGLHADTVGESSIDRAITYRMHETKCNTTGEYYKLIREGKEEFSELIEEVVVPETWFFRNIAPFEMLRDNALKIYNSTLKHKSKNSNNKKNLLKILSIPCSSGEEPYSIAMALYESGLDVENFKIDAIDISSRAIKKSCRAIYGKHSFREKGLEIKEKYFEKMKSGYRLIPLIRNCVDFKQGNLMTDKICPETGYYDVIFCRNLLIYFDRDTQCRVFEKLSIMLKPGGIVFVGHAEAGQIDKDIFSRVRAAKVFAFRKKISNIHTGDVTYEKEQPVTKLKDIYDQLVKVNNKDIEISKKIIRNRHKNTPKVVGKKNLYKGLFSEVDVLINSGRLSNANDACNSILKNDPENADAYYYLGLICNLQGSSSSAEAFLRKSIYLSPSHLKALSLSVILAENRGDIDNALSLRRREQNARKRNK